MELVTDIGEGGGLAKDLRDVRQVGSIIARVGKSGRGAKWGIDMPEHWRW
jgi:hypothetical protein